MARKKVESEVDELELEDDFDVEEDEEAKASKKKGKGKKKAEPKGIGATQVAEALGVDPKTFRAWLRRVKDNPDSGLELDHEHKARYNFGNTISSPQAKKVMKLWTESSHERGRPKKDEEESDEDE